MSSPRKTYFDRLPAEILFMIASLLTMRNAQVFQEAIGFYLGDAFWRSRIPKCISEALPLDNEALDW